MAHGIADKDAEYVSSTTGPAIIPFMYLGAKHMVTGIDHILFLFGVMFFLRRFTDIVVYVSLFSLGHSVTLIAGVLMNTGVNSSLVDAAIGVSIVYKAFDNLGGFDRFVGFRPEPRLAVLGFGLVHGLGLSTKVQDLGINPDGLLTNLLSFNVGVEVGQVVVLAIMLPALLAWQRSPVFGRTAVVVNWLIMVGGFILTGYHLLHYIAQRS
mgnify:CR=1 FL=1